MELVLLDGLDVDHALDVGELELGEEPVEDLEVLADLLRVLGAGGEGLLAEELTDLEIKLIFFSQRNTFAPYISVTYRFPRRYF